MTTSTQTVREIRNFYDREIRNLCTRMTERQIGIEEDAEATEEAARDRLQDPADALEVLHDEILDALRKFDNATDLLA